MPKKTPALPPMPILGEDASPDTIRRFLTKVNLREVKDEKGRYISPINGKTFDSYYALMGHIGAYLMERKTTPPTQDRRGYIKAIRKGLPTTDAQRAAHRDYMRKLRQRQRDAAVADLPDE